MLQFASPRLKNGNDVHLRASRVFPFLISYTLMHIALWRIAVDLSSRFLYATTYAVCSCDDHTDTAYAYTATVVLRTQYLQ